MRKAGKALSILLTCARGLNSVSGWLKHYVFVTFTLHFIFCRHTGSLDSRNTSARVREEGKRGNGFPLTSSPACNSPVGLLPESLC